MVFVGVFPSLSTPENVAQVCHRQSPFPFKREEGEERLSPSFSNSMYHQKRIKVIIGLLFQG